MNLNQLSNEQLIDSTERALQTMREAEVEVLRHFREIEMRRLWIHAGSLYKFISLSFHLTDDQIYPRLQAMRLMTAMPEVEQKLEDGQLSVTNALKAQRLFTAESKQRQVPTQEKREVLESLKNVSTRSADKVLAEKYPAVQTLPEKVRPVAKNQNLIQFYVDDETLKQMDALKAKYAHQMPSGKMEDLIKILIQTAHRQPQPRKRIEIKTRSRHIPSEVKREMEKTRHEGCCYVDPNSGSRCGSQHFLQRDHIHEYSRGGLNLSHNLRWLCAFHNRNRGETGRDASGARVT
jgi:hypothetical protein